MARKDLKSLIAEGSKTLASMSLGGGDSAAAKEEEKKEEPEEESNEDMGFGHDHSTQARAFFLYFCIL